MSLRYKGAVISATPPTLVAGAGASGAWTLQQQMQAIASGYWPVNGPFYIEEVFSTYLYTGNSSTQTINNGIDLLGKGGMVWLKSRGPTGYNHYLYDTNRGATKVLFSNLTNSYGTQSNGLTAFNNNGFTQGSFIGSNGSGENYVSWTFRKQPKFFDVVTYTGNGVAGRQIAHSLGSLPGFIVVKSMDTARNWTCYHRSLGAVNTIALNLTSAASSAPNDFNSTLPTASVFTVGSDASLNANGVNYVAYLFAHNAGGFGLTGSDNVISCGSFTQVSGVANVTLGYEPQWVLIKRTDAADNWTILDNMRGVYSSVNTPSNALFPNTSGAESSGFYIGINATGFDASGLSTSGSYIYIAIRRGPMKTPTSGTSVFTPIARTGTRAAGSVTGIGFPPDNLITLNRTPGGYQPEWNNKLVGPTKFLKTATTAAEATSTDLASYDQDGVSFNATDFNSIVNLNSPLIQYFMRRAPGFFDVVCYTGTGSNTTQTHNLGVVPEMMIFKRRDTTANWRVYHSSQPASDLGILNSTSFFQTDTNVLNSTAPTASVFTVGTNAQTNASGGTYVAYLFATVAGVSKVGSYTGTGTTKQIDCGFTGGARFVLIKRVDDSGDWYVWDSARGIVAGNDPYLLLNSTAAEVTNTDYVDTLNAGFEISSTAPAAINANGGTFIFLAIA